MLTTADASGSSVGCSPRGLPTPPHGPSGAHLAPERSGDQEARDDEQYVDADGALIGQLFGTANAVGLAQGHPTSRRMHSFESRHYHTRAHPKGVVSRSEI